MLESNEHAGLWLILSFMYVYAYQYDADFCKQCSKREEHLNDFEVHEASTKDLEELFKF